MEFEEDEDPRTPPAWVVSLGENFQRELDAEAEAVLFAQNSSFFYKPIDNHQKSSHLEHLSDNTLDKNHPSSALGSGVDQGSVIDEDLLDFAKISSDAERNYVNDHWDGANASGNSNTVLSLRRASSDADIAVENEDNEDIDNVDKTTISSERDRKTHQAASGSQVSPKSSTSQKSTVKGVPEKMKDQSQTLNGRAIGQAIDISVSSRAETPYQYMAMDSTIADRSRSVSGSETPTLPLTEKSISMLRDASPSPNQRTMSTIPGKAFDGHKNVINVYQRLLGRKSSTSIKASLPVSDEASMTVTSIKDRFLSFMSGETEKERKARIRLGWYGSNLQEEASLFMKVRQHHSQHRRELMSEFEGHEIQLQKWGLFHVLPSFRTQAWIRISRSRLLEEMSLIAIRKFMNRQEKCRKIVNHFTENRHTLKQDLLNFYNEFSSTSSESLLSRDVRLSSAGYRLTKMDRICTVYLNNFRKRLPSVEPQSLNQRTNNLQDLAQRYEALIRLPAPNQENDNDKAWNEFCIWYTKRHEKMLKIESDFSSFVEDEREREGRLFKRWCSLVTTREAISSTTRQSMSSIPMNPVNIPTRNTYMTQFPSYMQVASHNPRESMTGRNDSISQPAVLSSSATIKDTSANKVEPKMYPDNDTMNDSTARKSQSSPRSVRAFIRYFAGELCNKYKTDEFRDTLVILTETLVFRRIHDVTLRYSNQSLLLRDVKWRNKCKLCKLVSPTTFGVPALYVYGPDPPQSAAATDNHDDHLSKALEHETDDVDGGKRTFDPLCDCDGHPKSIVSSNKSSMMSWISSDSASFSLPDISLYSRLQYIPTDSQYGKLYGRAAKILHQIASSTTPREIIFNLLLAVKMLSKDAALISKKNEVFGADLMFPILVTVLVYANIPNIHMIAQFLHDYADFEGQQMGEAAYYTTCLHAAIAFVIRVELPKDIIDSYNQLQRDSHQLGSNNLCPDELENESQVSYNILASSTDDHDGPSATDMKKSDGQQPHKRHAEKKRVISDGSDSPILNIHSTDSDDAQLVAKAASDDMNDEKAIKSLSEWVRDQITMEDTISILQEEGWMV